MSVNISKSQHKNSSTLEDNLSQLDEEKNDEGCPHPALLNHVIIQCIFENLDKHDFRNCRLVCQKWKSVGESSFKKKVRLRLCFVEEDFEEGVDLVKDGKETKLTAPRNLVQFFNMSQTEFPFTAVRFINHLFWPPTQISNLFSTEGRFITDLKLENVALKSENYTIKKFLKSYDLTPILGRIENLKRLTLNRDFTDDTTRWLLSFENLENIQYINIETCSIEFKINPEIISPIDLRLEDCIFLRKNIALKNIHLNEFVNFEAMEKLSLVVSRNTKGTKIFLDVSGSKILKKAEFYKIDLVNFEESYWIVNDLECSFSPFDKPTKMIIKQLVICNCDCIFKSLPASLEDLSLREKVNIVDGMDPTLWNFSLPQLKSLELREIDVIEKCLPYLTRYCHNLNSLVLDADLCMDEVTIHRHMIPPTVKYLNLTGEYKLVGQGGHALDCLKMREFDYYMDSVLPALRFFELKCFDLWLPFLKPADPVVKALFETSIPQVDLGYFSSVAFSYLKENYTFDSIDKVEEKKYVIVNGRGSTISIIVNHNLDYRDTGVHII